MADDLPVPADDQQPYLHLQPAETPLDPTNVTSACRRLHTLADPSHSVIDRLNPLTTTRPPTVECLFLRPEAPTDRLNCYWTLHGSTAIADLEDTLRDTLPDQYQVTATTGDPLTDLQPHAESHVAGVQYEATTTHRKDWQTALVPFHTAARDQGTPAPTANTRPTPTETDTPRPLETVLSVLATCDCPAAYQVLIRPFPDWRQAADERTAKIELGSNRITGTLFANPSEVPIHREPNLTPTAQARHDAITARDPTRSFVVTSRAVAVAPDPTTASATADRLETALDPLSGQFHEIGGRRRDDADTGVLDIGTPPGQQLLADMRARTLQAPSYESTTSRLPGTTAASTGIVVDAAELPQFCLLDGASAPADVSRALETVPPAQTTIERPPDRLLRAVEGPGLTLGHPRTTDRTSTAPIALPPDRQSLHLGWIGRTGAGKSTALLTAILDNYQATDGPEILIDRKGGRLPTEYLRSHYERYGDLDDVYYFDCAERLPAISFFDIRTDLTAGIARQRAIDDRVAHYEEILAQFMGAEEYDAARSTEIINYLVKALYDPVHGSDVLTHSEIETALHRLHDRETPPAVSTETLERKLATQLATEDSRTFERVMAGARNRMEKLTRQTVLERLFDHAPTGSDPRFDFAELLDEDAVVIFDLGRLRSEAKRGLTLVLLSNCWAALRRRYQQASAETTLPLVNLYLEEAGAMANSALVQDLLSRGREFRCSVTLAMQFPGQLRAADESTYAELLNNVGTYVTGNVGVDHDFAHRFATTAMDRAAVANRLRNLGRG
ncbi:hypothetical protein [Halorientalis marina]|uniref:hypothetical protein n=1 Tax=Halorientalis marina TaxID=2931976 RepID=UPI001FF2A9DD|nr:hypothetical protein [Halorientalis marina]